MSLLCQHFSSARARAELGYTIRPLEQSVEDSWKWFCDQGYIRRGRLTDRRKAS